MNQNQQNAALAGVAGAFICVGIVLIIVLVIYVFFCLTLQRTMSAVRPRNQQFAPGLVWLHMLHLAGPVVPFVGPFIGLAASIWDLVMVLLIAKSLQREFEDRGWTTSSESFGRIVGLIWTAPQLAVLPLSLGFGLAGPAALQGGVMIALGLVVIVVGLSSFICWIAYWVAMAQYGNRLRGGRGGRRRSSEEDDFDDDFRGSRNEDDDFRDRRRRRRDDDEDDRDDDRPRRRPRDYDD